MLMSELVVGSDVIDALTFQVLVSRLLQPYRISVLCHKA